MKLSIFFSLFFFYNFVQAQMIQVRSTLYDVAQQEEQTIQGVGSLILAEGKSFILTVGHVSSGKNLQLLGDRGSNFQPITRYDDFENDLTLIEVRPTPEQIEQYGLAIYGERRGVQGKALLTFLVDSSIEPDRKTFWKTDMLTYRKYRTFIVDEKGLMDYVSQDPDYEKIKYGPAEILLSSWLPLYTRSQWDELIDRHRLKWREVPKSNDAKNFQLDLPFLPGYSGSPILIHHGSSGTSMTPPFTLGGIVTLSNSDSEVSGSHVVGSKAINRLVELAIRGRKNAGAPPTWFLLNSLFAKLDQVLTVFRYDGPVGNGIAPVGKPLASETTGFAGKNRKNDFIEKLESRMQNKNRPDLQTIPVEAALRELTTLSKDKDIDSRKLYELAQKMQVPLRIK